MQRFGQVEFSPASRQLIVAGRPVAIDRRCAAILALLVDESGRDVDKDRLLDAGWPGRIVHENSLAKAVGRLRQAMGDDADLLETVHGLGYRLKAEPSAIAAPSRPAPPVDGFRRHNVVAIAAGLAAAAMLAAFAGGLLLGEKDQLVRGEPADALGRVLWVDDHPQNNLEEKRYLERYKIAVYQVTNSEDALALLAMYKYRAVISDMNRNGKLLDGFTLLREMRRRNDRTPFFLYTYVQSQAQRNILAKAGGQGATVEAKDLYAAILPLFGKARKDRCQTNAAGGAAGC